MRTSNNVLFVTHKKVQCGVYEFGNDVYSAIRTSKKYNFILAECNSFEELMEYYEEFNPCAIIYNHHPSTMPWIIGKFTDSWIKHTKLIKHNIAEIPVPQFGIMHEVTQTRADTATSSNRLGYFDARRDIKNTLFDFYICPDPTLILSNSIVFKTGRLIPEFKSNEPNLDKVIIGSAGFGAANKQYAKIVEMVQDQFEDAEIRINIAFAEGDKDGKGALLCAEECHQAHTNPNIKLSITHNFFNKEELLHFLAGNSINVFLYNDKSDRGISSIIDNALAVNRPIAISDSTMFRHILHSTPSINAYERSLKDILNVGLAPLTEYKNEWTPENLCWEYELILDKAIPKYITPEYSTKERRQHLTRTIINSYKKDLPAEEIKRSVKWLRTSKKLYEDDYQKPLSGFTYKCINYDAPSRFNRILDTTATKLYAPTIEVLHNLVPNTTARKNPNAHQNQGFVFDTVFNFLEQYQNPKLLCVGSYEDTAYMALVKAGLKIDEIDPLINFTLQEYFSRPGNKNKKFDIIFSTSVIEHDPDDKSFVECVSDLLNPGGVFIMTCDFREGYKPGDSKPRVDERLYTKHDLLNRLPSYIPDCEFVGTPNWDDGEHDFVEPSGNYTFAGFVVKKKK